MTQMPTRASRRLTGAMVLIATMGVVAAYGCSDTLGPPVGAVRFTPPAHFRVWWQVAEACAGRSGDFDAVSWYTVPASDSFSLEGQTVNGAWNQDGNKIALGAGQMQNGQLVRHEMVHAIMQSGDHPRDIFLDQCADVVVCLDRCVSDAGGPPDTSASARIVAASAMEVTFSIIPNPVSLSSGKGWFSCLIAAKNYAPYPVRVAVPLYEGAPQGDFRLEVTALSPDTGGITRIYSPPTAYVLFAPAGTAGATRRLVGDVLPSPTELPPGQYQVAAWFITQPARPS